MERCAYRAEFAGSFDECAPIHSHQALRRHDGHFEKDKEVPTTGFRDGADPNCYEHIGVEPMLLSRAMDLGNHLVSYEPGFDPRVFPRRSLREFLVSLGSMDLQSAVVWSWWRIGTARLPTPRDQGSHRSPRRGALRRGDASGVHRVRGTKPPLEDLFTLPARKFPAFFAAALGSLPRSRATPSCPESS